MKPTCLPFVSVSVTMHACFRSASSGHLLPPSTNMMTEGDSLCCLEHFISNSHWCISLCLFMCKRLLKTFFFNSGWLHCCGAFVLFYFNSCLMTLLVDRCTCVWTTCPESLHESGTAGSRTRDLMIATPMSNQFTTTTNRVTVKYWLW